jgi:uncharacterized protein (TIGR00251 family)
MRNFYDVTDNKIFIYIKAQPNSSKNKISGLYGEMLKINIKAPAVEGAANKELVKFISKEFKIPKSDIEIKGETSKKKTLIVPLREDILEKIKSVL